MPSVHLATGLAERVIVVLQDYLPAELTAVDTLEGGGITTPVIADADYHAWDRKNVPQFPACTIRVVSSQKIAMDYPSSGNILDAWHRLDVMFHAGLKQTDDIAAQTLQVIVQRYAQAALRVLCMEKVHLETVADPTEFVSLVIWPDGEPITYGPEADQADGSIVRTATLPIAIRRIEANA